MSTATTWWRAFGGLACGAGWCREGSVQEHHGRARELEAWLAERQVQLVAMEAAGVYWKLVLYALESRFTVWLCNGRSGGQEGPARMGFLLGLSGRPARPIAFAVVATMRTGFEVGPGGVPVRRS